MRQPPCLGRGGHSGKQEYRPVLCEAWHQLCVDKQLAKSAINVSRRSASFNLNQQAASAADHLSINFVSARRARLIDGEALGSKQFCHRCPNFALPFAYHLWIARRLGAHLRPALRERSDFKDRPLPHVYWRDDKPFLCLFDPAQKEWNASMAISRTTVPWISDWLYFYETWSLTGKWLSGGRHPGDPVPSASSDQCGGIKRSRCWAQVPRTSLPPNRCRSPRVLLLAVGTNIRSCFR
jgi:hypothetical protein